MKLRGLLFMDHHVHLQHLAEISVIPAVNKDVLIMGDQGFDGMSYGE